MIVRAREIGLPWSELETGIQELEHLCTAPRAANVRERLMALVAPETHHPTTPP
jgi:hypothetical protein